MKILVGAVSFCLTESKAHFDNKGVNIMKETSQGINGGKTTTIVMNGENILLDTSPEIFEKICEEYGFPALKPADRINLQCNCGCERTYEATLLGVGIRPECAGCESFDCPENNRRELCIISENDQIGTMFLKRRQAKPVDHL